MIYEQTLYYKKLINIASWTNTAPTLMNYRSNVSPPLDGGVGYLVGLWSLVFLRNHFQKNAHNTDPQDRKFLCLLLYNSGALVTEISDFRNFILKISQGSMFFDLLDFWLPLQLLSVPNGLFWRYRNRLLRRPAVLNDVLRGNVSDSKRWRILLN